MVVHNWWQAGGVGSRVACGAQWVAGWGWRRNIIANDQGLAVVAVDIAILAERGLEEEVGVGYTVSRKLI